MLLQNIHSVVSAATTRLKVKKKNIIKHDLNIIKEKMPR